MSKADCTKGEAPKLKGVYIIIMNNNDLFLSIMQDLQYSHHVGLLIDER